MRKNVSFILYLLLGIGSVLFGLFYAIRSEVMPFHLSVIGQEWNDLSDGTQTILMVLLKEMGVGQIVLGLSVLLIALGPWRKGDNWARFSAPAIGVVGMALTTVFAYEVTMKSGLASPWPASAAATVLYIVAFLLSPKGAKNV